MFVQITINEVDKDLFKSKFSCFCDKEITLKGRVQFFYFQVNQTHLFNLVFFFLKSNLFIDVQEAHL